MAKGMQKGNREIRKPKSDKPKAPAASTSPFPAGGVMKKGPPPTGKKGR